MRVGVVTATFRRSTLPLALSVESYTNFKKMCVVSGQKFRLYILSLAVNCVHNFVLLRVRKKKLMMSLADSFSGRSLRGSAR